MGKYFGTDGFRGEVGKTLTAEHAYRIGRYLGYLYRKEEYRGPGIVIGKDTRCSGDILETALAAGMSASGADVSLLSVVTTPCVSFLTAEKNYACGVMISASHNPFYDNGIKLVNEKGEKIDDDTIAKIEAYLDGNEELPFATGKAVGRVRTASEEKQIYIKRLTSLCNQKPKRLHIGLDCANGSASFCAKEVFTALGAKVETINDTPDGFNINDNAGSTHIAGLCKFVKEKKLDVGFAFDGDADRLIAVDENGNEIDGDFILYVLGKDLAEEKKLVNNTVVTTVMSNMGLYRALEDAGVAYAQTKVGDRFVYENMQATGNCLGGEQSGHIILSEFATTGDGILTAIKLCEVMEKKKKTLGELASPMKKFPQTLKNIRVTDKTAIRNHPAVVKKAEEISKALGKDGRLLLRESGTEPLIRVMVEADTQEKSDRYVDEMIALIQSVLEA